ncbi:MAG: pyrophosphatase [Parvibaculaceae bacterium]|nr:pyrophosphatase [Parvibaculaceae bacterium]
MTSLISLTTRFEQASKKYAADNGITRTEEWFTLKMQEELGELTQAWMKWAGHGRRKGKSEAALHHDMSDETADLLGHVLLFARQHNIDLEAAISRKWRFDPTTDAPNSEVG